MRRFFVVVGAVAALTLYLAVGGLARPVALHRVFREISGAVSTVISNGRYAFVEPSGPPGELGTLIDERTGRRTQLSRLGCVESLQGSPIDGAWLIFGCGAASAPVPTLSVLEMYSLRGGGWRSVAPSLQQLGSSCSVQCVWPTDAGSVWIEYRVSKCPDGQHCTSEFNEFQDIRTGQLRSDPTGGRTIADLNLPSLARQLCAPLRVPTAFHFYAGFGPGSLSMDGRFAIAQGNVTDPMNPFPVVYLERCGSALHKLLVGGPDLLQPPSVAWNAHAVIWQSAPRTLSGLFLPSLHQFTLSIPNAAISPHCLPDDFRSCLRTIALTDHTLYLLNANGYANGQLWVTKAPTEPLKH